MSKPFDELSASIFCSLHLYRNVSLLSPLYFSYSIVTSSILIFLFSCKYEFLCWLFSFAGRSCVAHSWSTCAMKSFIYLAGNCNITNWVTWRRSPEFVEATTVTKKKSIRKLKEKEKLKYSELKLEKNWNIFFFRRRFCLYGVA